MLDLEPATSVLARLVENIKDEQLDAPTPCPEMTVGALLDHVDGLSLAFAEAAAKTTPGPEGRVPSADAAGLRPDWRTGIPQRLAELAQAWRVEDAWTGMTAAGGVELPGDVAGLVALDEVIVHGWDLAVATGQDFGAPEPLVEATFDFVRPSAEENPEGSPGLFGPPVPVPASAPAIDRLIGLTGRDPGWRPVG
ncbi:TIGR03086 family metal-binding protein [Amycolatopsis nigrescens]|uniref:TIGR03086 family metal-binding protein n=1 Tax=Amycolatopsis nigrescens TaxID=381445 RepID=UPI0003606032|nr:TIGR03086 family metal-binding protein [Amycolatopsis nigrescens]